MFCISGKMASAVAPSFRSTKETTNYARLCRLLVDVSAHILRETFDKRRPTGDLHTVLSSPPVHAVLQSLRKKRIISPLQWGKLYPAIKSAVSSKNFDITLLMVLLRNICGLVRPATGWDTQFLLPRTQPLRQISFVSSATETQFMVMPAGPQLMTQHSINTGRTSRMHW